MLIEDFENSEWSLSSLTVEGRVAGGLNHTVVGEIIGRKWDIGDRLCDVARKHHDGDVDDRLAFVVGLADVLSQVLYPFPRESQFPVARALRDNELERIPGFLPEGFFDQPLVSPSCAPLARILSPV